MDFADYSLIPPVDIIPKLYATEYKEKIESKKWSERVEAIKELSDLLDSHPNLLMKDRGAYKELIGKMDAILQRDSNINVSASAAKALKGLACGLRFDFQPFAPSVIAISTEKLKEKKTTLRTPLIECMDAVALTTPLKNYVDKILEGIAKPNPSVREQVLLFLYRLFNQHNKRTSGTMALVELAPALNKVTSDPDPDVRNAANLAIAAALRCVGIAVGEKCFFAEAMSDGARKTKIVEECNKLIAEFQDNVSFPILYLFDPKSRPQSQHGAATSLERDGAPVGEEENSTAVDPFNLIPAVDIIPKLYATEFKEKVDSKKWNERVEAIKELIDLLDTHPRLEIKDRVAYRELIAKMDAILQRDSNINVSASAAKALKGLACGMRFDFQPFAPSVIAASIEKLKEKKATLRTPLIECMDAVALTTPLKNYADKILEGMVKPNPSVREQVLHFLYRLFNQHNKRTSPSMMLSELAPAINKATSDSDPDVRNAANLAIAAILRCVGVAVGEKCFFAEAMGDASRRAKIVEECNRVVAEYQDNAAPSILLLSDSKPQVQRVQAANATKEVPKRMEREEKASRNGERIVSAAAPSNSTRTPAAVSPKITSRRIESVPVASRPIRSSPSPVPNPRITPRNEFPKEEVTFNPKKASEKAEVIKEIKKGNGVARRVDNLLPLAPGSNIPRLVRK